MKRAALVLGLMLVSGVSFGQEPPKITRQQIERYYSGGAELHANNPFSDERRSSPLIVSAPEPPLPPQRPVPTPVSAGNRR